MIQGQKSMDMLCQSITLRPFQIMKRRTMETVKLKDDYIKLSQALKVSGLAESGVDAKYAILDGKVKVNGQTELQRGKKLRAGDVVSYDGETVRIEA